MRTAVRRDPFGARVIGGRARDITFQWERVFFRRDFGRDGTRANAFRHAMWNAVGVWLIGRTRTQRLTDAHEWCIIDRHSRMDLRNNAAGRRIGQLYLDRHSRSWSFCDRRGWVFTGPNHFYYEGIRISLVGDHFSNMARMVHRATQRGNGRILTWLY